MKCNELEKYLVQIISGGEIGSGILLKPMDESEFIYILTAKHVIGDINNIQINYNFDSKLETLITYSDYKAIDKDQNEVFFKRIENIPKVNHLEILIIKAYLLDGLKPLKVYTKHFTSSKIVGYPKITEHTVECLKLEDNELSNMKPLMKVESLKPLFSSEKREKDNTVGYSGGGIFVDTTSEIYLVGITTHVETTAFQGFKYSPLDDINSFLGEYPKIQTFNDILDNSNINKIRSISNLNYESANIFIDGNYEDITLDTLYIKRDVEDDIFNFLNSENRYSGIVIKGEAGNGKTSLLWKIAKDLKECHHECWFLKSSNFLNIASLFDEIKNSIILFQKEHNKDLVILIDTIDLISSQESIMLELNSLVSDIRMLEINVIFILTSREIESRSLKPLKLKSFDLTNYNENTSELNNAIKSYVECFYNEKQTMDKEESLNKILSGVTEGRSLKEVCKHPLTLRMLFIIYYPSTIPEEINVFKLYKDFWEKRIVNDIRAGENNEKDFEDLSSLTGKIAFIMLAEGMIELNEDILINWLDYFSFDRKSIEILIKRKILTKSNNNISFFHQTFFEHACAREFINIFKNDALNIFENKIKDTFDNLFLMPIYEQMILLTSLKGAFYKDIVKSKFETLCSTNFNSKYSAIYIFSHMHNSLDLKEIFMSFLKKDIEDETLIIRFLSVIYNINNTNIEFIIEVIQIIWETKKTKYRLYILSMLEELSYQNSKDIYEFIVKNDIETYILNRKLKGATNNSVLSLVKLYLNLISIDEEVVLDKILNFTSPFFLGNKGTFVELKTISLLSKNKKINENKKYLQKILIKYNQKKHSKEIILAYGIYLCNYFIANEFSINEVFLYINEEKQKCSINYSILIASLSEYVKFKKTIENFEATIIYLKSIEDILTQFEIVAWGDFYFLNLLGVYQEDKRSFIYKNSILKFMEILLLEICTGNFKYTPLVKKVLYATEIFGIEDYNFFNNSNFNNKDLWLDRKKLGKFLIQGYLAKNKIAEDIIEYIICEKEKSLINISFNFLLKKLIKFDLVNKNNIVCFVEYILYTNNFVVLNEIYIYNNQNIIKLLRMNKILEIIENHLYNNIETLSKRTSPSNIIKANVQTLSYFLEKELITKIKYKTLINYFKYNNCLNNLGKVIDSYFIKNIVYINQIEKQIYLDDIFILLEERIIRSKYYRASIIATFEVLRDCIISTNLTATYIEKYYELLIKITFHDKNTIKFTTEYSKNVFYLLTDLMPNNVEQFINIFIKLINIFNEKITLIPSGSIDFFSTRIEIPLTNFFKSKYVNEKDMLCIFTQLEKSDSQLSRGIITAVFNNSQNKALMDAFDMYIQEKNIDSILLQKINNHKKHHKEQALDSDWVELYDLLEDRK